MAHERQRLRTGGAVKPRKIYLAFQFVQDTKLSSGSAAGCLGLMNVLQGSWVCREPGAALQASQLRWRKAAVSIGPGCWWAKQTSQPGASFQASLRPHFKWACYPLNNSTGGVELLSPAISLSKSFIPSEPKLCVELILYYRVWPWENHVCIISAQTKPAVLALYLETHHSVPQFLPLPSAWAVYTSLHTCSTGKADSMEKPRLAPPRDFVPCGDPAHLHMVQTGNLHRSDSTKNQSS